MSGAWTCGEERSHRNGAAYVGQSSPVQSKRIQVGESVCGKVVWEREREVSKTLSLEILFNF